MPKRVLQVIIVGAFAALTSFTSAAATPVTQQSDPRLTETVRPQLTSSSSSPFCGVRDFQVFHYTTTNPHYDNWDFVYHMSEVYAKHWHYWIEPTYHGIRKVECPVEDWFTP